MQLQKDFFFSRNGTRLVHSLKSGLKLGRCSHFSGREKEKGETERKTLGIKEVSGLRWELRGQGRGLEKNVFVLLNMFASQS